MKNEYRTRRQLRLEFIKSAAVFLLAMVMLVSMVLAWLETYSNVIIDPFTISIRGGNGEEFGSDVVTDRLVILPSATILGDPDISVVDFSNSIKVMPLEVESSAPNDISIEILTAPGLHFFIDTNYDKDEDSALTYAQTIMDNFYAGSGNDLSIPMQYDLTPVTDKDGTPHPKDQDSDGFYRHWVAVVYWADYDHITQSGDSIGDIINKTGNVSLTSSMSFKRVNDKAGQ